MTGGEGGAEGEGGGILCNRVESTKERRTHAFVIFVLLLPSLVPHLPFLLRPFDATFRVR